jgi:hypothetical protein
LVAEGLFILFRLLPFSRAGRGSFGQEDGAMSTKAKQQKEASEGSRMASAEQRLKELGIQLPAPPEPFGTYVESVQTGNCFF